MKVYQMLIPAVLCLLAILLARSEASADDELRRLNDKLFEITKELERRLEARQMTDPEYFVGADHKRGGKHWNLLGGHSALAMGKRAEDGEQTDRSKKTKYGTGSRGLSALLSSSGWALGKRAEYQPEDLLALEDMADGFGPYDNLPAKKAGIRGFTGHSALLYGKRNADESQE